MNPRSLLGMALAAASCWPIWLGLAALAERDYLACGLGLALAWLMARTGLELLRLQDGGAAQPQPRAVPDSGG